MTEPAAGQPVDGAGGNGPAVDDERAAAAAGAENNAVGDVDGAGEAGDEGAVSVAADSKRCGIDRSAAGQIGTRVVSSNGDPANDTDGSTGLQNGCQAGHTNVHGSRDA